MPGFSDYFVENMKSLEDTIGLPASTSLYGNATSIAAASAALAKAVETYGAECTIGELVAKGVLSEQFGSVAVLASSFYLGAVVGSIAVALGRTLADGASISDVVEEFNSRDRSILKKLKYSDLFPGPDISIPRNKRIPVPFKQSKALVQGFRTRLA